MPKCQVCLNRDTFGNTFWCGKTCRNSGRPGSINEQVLVKNCKVCRKKPVFRDTEWCGNDCKLSGKPGSQNYNISEKQCRICRKPTIWDGRQYSLGCCYSHTRLATKAMVIS